MRFSNLSQNVSERPMIQMAPLIDVVFLLLIFFMASSIFYQFESEIDINVPTAKESSSMERTPGEIIINVRKDGTIVVNQRTLSEDELKVMLTRVSSMYKGQPVIVRADGETYHKDIVNVLDVCAGADIWNVSFATMEEDRKK